jgi:flagellar FliL protein
MANASKMNFDSGGRMAEEDADEGGGNSGKKFLIIIFLVLLLLIGGGAVAYFIFFSTNKKEATSSEQPSQEQISEDITSASEKEVTKLSNPIFTQAKKYVVNLRDGRHFLTVSLVAALEDPDALVFLVSREPIIDDMMITLLGNLTSEDLGTPSGKALLKREIYKKINGIFTQEFIDDSETHDATPVKNVLFTEFILN